MRVWCFSWNCPHMRWMRRRCNTGAYRGPLRVASRLDRYPDFEATHSGLGIELVAVRSKFGASATSCPDSGSHLLQIVMIVRRMVEICSRWENTAYLCGPIRTRLKPAGRSEKSVTSTPAM